MKLSEIIQSPIWANELMRRWLAILIGFIMAIVVSFWIADQQMLKLAILAAMLLTALVAVGMQRNAWLLILVAWNLQGSIYALPLPLSVRDIAIILATNTSIAFSVVTGKSSREPWGALQILVAVLCAHVALTFVIHPVGVRALGAETMGARPYFNMLLAACAYWVIVHMPESYKSVCRVPLWIVTGASFLAVLNLVVFVFPSTTRFILPFYGGVDYSTLFRSTAADEPEIRRFMQLGIPGLTIIQVLAAYYPPRTFFNPLRVRCYLFLLSLSMLFAAGYRNTLLYALACLAIASWLHRGWREVALWGVAVALFFGILVAGQGRLYKLPLTAQRALDFLPGQWDEVVTAETKESSEGRFEWWRQILSEGAIKNWWVGDGFGVSQQDFELMAFRGNTFDFFTVTGTYHNGPLTTIRYAGVIGLVLFYLLMIIAAVYAVKCAIRFRGTPLFPLAVFLAIRLVWGPFHFTLIYGSFDTDFPDMMFMVSLLCLATRMSKQHPSPVAPVTERTNNLPFPNRSGLVLRPGEIRN